MSPNLTIPCPLCLAKNRVDPQRLDTAVCGKCKAPLVSPNPLELDADTFDKLALAGDLPVLVDFWAPWCGPCKMMAPALAQAATELAPQVRVAKLNTQDHQEMSQRYSVFSIPTLILFAGGQEKDRISGARSAAEIVQWTRSRI